VPLPSIEINANEQLPSLADTAHALQPKSARSSIKTDSGDLATVRRIAYANRSAWHTYLQQIVKAAQGSGDE
jgi:hypothetical protein